MRHTKEHSALLLLTPSPVGRPPIPTAIRFALGRAPHKALLLLRPTGLKVAGAWPCVAMATRKGRGAKSCRRDLLHPSIPALYHQPGMAVEGDSRGTRYSLRHAVSSLPPPASGATTTEANPPVWVAQSKGEAASPPGSCPRQRHVFGGGGANAAKLVGRTCTRRYLWPPSTSCPKGVGGRRESLPGDDVLVGSSP